MDLIKFFVDNDENIEINIQGTVDEPLFQANQIGKLLGLTNINKNIKDFDQDEKVLTLSYSNGGKQNMSFLTEIGLYRILGMSRKEKARKFQKWIATVVKEIRINGKYELEKSLKDTIQNHEKDIQQQRHDLLLTLWDDTPGVYIGKIKDMDDGKYVIKIGNTIDIKKRTSCHQNKYQEFILFDFFKANRHIQLEQSLYKNDFIAKHKYVEEVNGIKSTETFCVSKEIYKTIVQIIEKRQKDYQGFSQEDCLDIIQKENDIKKIQEQKELELVQLQKWQAHNYMPVIVIKEKYTPLPHVIKEKKITKGRKIQKYTPEGQLLQTYTGISNAIRTEIEDNLSETGLRFALKKAIEYRGFRWVYLERDLPDNTVQDIGDNNTTIRRIPIDLIAMLDIDNKYIIDVFRNQREAANSRHLITTFSVYNSIKKNVLCKGHHFNFFSKCTEEQKNKYMENNTLPETDRHFNAKRIKQINPITNEVMAIHNSMSDIRLKFQIGQGTIKKVILANEVYKSFLWAYDD